jgi:hypothetical protein
MDLSKITKQQLIMMCNELNIKTKKSMTVSFLKFLIDKNPPTTHLINQSDDTNPIQTNIITEEPFKVETTRIQKNNINEQYSPISIEITNLLSKDEKKKQGIFITPKTIIETVMNETLGYINKEKIQIATILEPSCGTCEIISFLNNLFKDVIIDGIELNATIFEKIINIDFNSPNTNQINLINLDFLCYPTIKKYDLIVSNPPYVVCDKSLIPKDYNSWFIGRTNLFCIFIIHSLHLLNDNGIATFIIPKSFINSNYYSLVRNYIKSCCIIVKILDLNNDFIDTDQSTICLILRKVRLPDEYCDYSIKLNNNYILTLNKPQTYEIFNNSTTLSTLGFSVKTGNIVWNEKKNMLTPTPSDLTSLLIYNSNISKNNTITILDFKQKGKTTKPQEKFQYINIKGSTDPVIVVNRGNGNSTYKLNYALVDMDMPFVCENHLNVIYSKTIQNKTELLTLYNKIIDSFNNPKTQLFISSYLGNNALSKTELETIFPIYL